MNTKDLRALSVIATSFVAYWIFCAVMIFQNAAR